MIENEFQNNSIKKALDWKETTERFVAFFDIMGFQDLVARKTHNFVKEKLESLAELRKTIHSLSDDITISADFNLGKSKSFAFSDSIIIFTMGNDNDDANKIIADSLFLISNSYKLGIPVKGAISYGEITVNLDNNIFFGQPIIDAYLLHNELNQYSVVLDNHIENKIAEMQLNKKLLNTIHQSKIKFKTGWITHSILAPNIKDILSKQIDQLKDYYKTVSGSPRQYIDNTVECLTSIIIKLDTLDSKESTEIKT